MSPPRCILALLVVGSWALAAAQPAPSPTRITFSLRQPATTSAGIYSAQGRLVRTLWRAEELPAGAHERTWDQRDDDGRLQPAGEYDVRLMHHRLSYVWEGVVGNSSSVFVGPGVHKAMQLATSIAIDGQQAHYAVGYNEQQPGLHGFKLSSPNLNSPAFAVAADAFAARSMVAIDGARLYWANTGGLSHTSFIAAEDRLTTARAPWPTGQDVCLARRPDGNCYEDQRYKSVIDIEHDRLDAPTGLAVQRHGRVLAVAHGGRNVLRLFDKHTGQRLREWRVELAPKALNQIAMAADGALWVISGKSILRYTALERGPVVTTVIGSLSQPLAIASGSESDHGVWVADGGSSQQLKRFDSQGRAGPVIGQRGGMADDPKVGADALCFQAGPGSERTALGVEGDGSVWVVDQCNNRLLRFRADASARWRSDAQVAWLPASYLATVDHGNPQRVFANFLEFELASMAPLAAGDRSWRLVRNWLAGMPAALIDEHAANHGFGGFTSVRTLANGRTFALMKAHGRQAIVELPALGPLRLVKWLATPALQSTPKVLYENGDLGYAVSSATAQSVVRLPLQGFDAAGDPVWSADPVKLASVPKRAGSPFYRGAFSGMPPRFPLTGSGRIVFFDSSVTGNEGFHLGAAALDDNDWLWQASPSGALDGKGTFQTRAIDGSLQYGGNAVWAHGRHIVYGYHGEGYKDLHNQRVGQANQFMHFDESGLFLGQFGLASTRSTSTTQAGLSGNAFSPTLVRQNERLFVYHNDESSHGGVHRWRIDGWDLVAELVGRGNAGSAIVLR